MTALAKQTAVNAAPKPLRVCKKYLTFLLASNRYSINILKVREIIEYSEITPMPMMPEFITGALNLRGKVVPVVDLAQRLGGEKSTVTSRSCIIVVELDIYDETMSIGILVDSVNKVHDIEPHQIEKTPDFGGNIRSDFIEGMGKVDDQFVVILKVEKILSFEDVKVLQAVSEGGANNAMPGDVVVSSPHGVAAGESTISGQQR
ncbi:chemotaxis protein CheW [Pseudomonadota bacterium]